MESARHGWRIGGSVDLIDTAEIAAMLGVSRAHVTDRLTKQPSFPAPKIARSQRLRRWDRADVLAWMTRQEKKAA